jgi:hypothetical protein
VVAASRLSVLFPNVGPHTTYHQPKTVNPTRNTAGADLGRAAVPHPPLAANLQAAAGVFAECMRASPACLCLSHLVPPARQNSCVCAWASALKHAFRGRSKDGASTRAFDDLPAGVHLDTDVPVSANHPPPIVRKGLTLKVDSCSVFRVHVHNLESPSLKMLYPDRLDGDPCRWERADPFRDWVRPADYPACDASGTCPRGCARACTQGERGTARFVERDVL